MTRNLVLPPRRQHVIIVDTFSSDVIFIREREQDFSSLGNISTELFTGETHFTEGDSPQMTGRSKFHPAAREQISFVSRNFPWLYHLSVLLPFVLPFSYIIISRKSIRNFETCENIFTHRTHHKSPNFILNFSLYVHFFLA